MAMTVAPTIHTNHDLSRCQHQPAIDGLRGALNAVLLGKENVVESLLAGLLARGHILFEDLPGLGKTTLAKALSAAVGGRYARVQCTPDLLPTDITGFHLFNQKTQEFEFVPGPVFSDVMLADEINRATPRTQSALFEAMAERQVTLDSKCHSLSETFFVIATQNPVESHGAYPLPEAQLDRFAMKLRIGYPDRSSEVRMLEAHLGAFAYERDTTPIVTPHELRALQEHVASVSVAPALREYLVDLATATRSHRKVKLGLSPRGLLTWQRVSQARAHLQGRDFVMPDDIQEVAHSVLSVRLSNDHGDTEGIVREIVDSVTVPVFTK